MKTTYLAASLAALLVAGAAGWHVLSASHESVVHTDVIFSREVVAYEEASDGIVRYEYVGEKLPEKLVPDEDISKRSEASYSRLLAVENPGTKEEKRTYHAVFYTRPTFVETEDGWHYIEHATTTESAFNETRKENAFASLFWRKAYAATATPFSEAGDGQVSFQYGTFGTIVCGWSAIVDGSQSGGNATANATNAALSISTSYTSVNEAGTVSDECFAGIDRLYLPFNTGSTIGTGASISAATLSVYATAKSNGDNDGFDYASVFQTSQTTHTTLGGGDYVDMGSTEGIDAGQRKDITSVTTGAYLVFTLNATGISWIKTFGQASACSASSGYTCLGLREGHDFNNNQPGNNLAANSITFSMSEQTGTSQDPTLTVTYTGGTFPSGFSFWQFQDF